LEFVPLKFVRGRLVAGTFVGVVDQVSEVVEAVGGDAGQAARTTRSGD